MACAVDESVAHDQLSPAPSAEGADKRPLFAYGSASTERKGTARECLGAIRAAVAAAGVDPGASAEVAAAEAPGAAAQAEATATRPISKRSCGAARTG